MNPYQTHVSRYVELLKAGKALPLGRFDPAPRPDLGPEAPKAIFFAPHPDDECISGGVALRLLREARMRVLNVAVTLGSNKARRLERWAELEKACDYLGFGLVATAPSGLERINPKTRQEDTRHWGHCVRVIREIIERERPQVLIFPHEHDWNSTHIGTHFLVMDALKEMPATFSCHILESEFWGAMADPNLMVEIGANDLADMITATTFHVGEVARNPYHLSLPAWVMDNVRRGGELVGGQGGAAPDFPFAALYRLRHWSNRQAVRLFEGGKLLPSSVNIGSLFS